MRDVQARMPSTVSAPSPSPPRRRRTLCSASTTAGAWSDALGSAPPTCTGAGVSPAGPARKALSAWMKANSGMAVGVSSGRIGQVEQDGHPAAQLLVGRPVGEQAGVRIGQVLVALALEFEPFAQQLHPALLAHGLVA